MLLRKAYLTFHRRVNARLLKLGITADQFVVLSALGELDGVTQKAIVQHTASDPNTTTAILRLLEDRGLILRKPHAHDRRARCVSLTDDGRRLLEELTPETEPFQRELWTAIDPKMRQSLMCALAQIHDQFSAAADETRKTTL